MQEPSEIFPIPQWNISPHLGLSRTRPIRRIRAKLFNNKGYGRGAVPESGLHGQSFMKTENTWGMLKETFSEWSEDKASRLAAALAYYTVFSIAPIILIVVAVAGLAFGQEAAQGQIDRQLQSLMGNTGAQAIQQMVAHGREHGAGVIATILGLAALIFGASGTFAELKDSLNTIWEVQPKAGSGILKTIRDRFLSFTMVLGIGFLLLVSLVLSAALAAFGHYLSGLMPGMAAISMALNFFIAFAIITLLFAMMFKILPDVEIAWKDVWVGAAVTAFLFTIGKLAIGLYLGRGAFSSSYGAAGALIIVLLWVYYSAQILFFGAEFTQVYARRYGSRIVPSPAETGQPHAPAKPASRPAAHPVPARHSVPSPVHEKPAFVSFGSLAIGFALGLGLVRRKSRE
jgi:membrane protein